MTAQKYSPEWRKAYQRRRTAEKRYEQAKAYFDAGLEPSSGMRPEETLRLEELYYRLYDVQWRMTAPNYDVLEVSDLGGKLVEDFNDEMQQKDISVVYRRHLSRLAINALVAFTENIGRMNELAKQMQAKQHPSSD